MFVCSSCGASFQLPRCMCGNEVLCNHNIWQMTDSPNIVLDDESTEQFIGYEQIGAAYSGNYLYTIDERNALIAKKIAELTGAGIFLDVACGDGAITVPAANEGIQIIAGDISNTMMDLLQKKADVHKISLQNVTLCRLNAYALPLQDNCIDVAIANSVLHLVSSPKDIIQEIHRVLKVGGMFICLDDAPYTDPEPQTKNTSYYQFVCAFDGRYWEIMRSYGLTPKKLNWHFDRDSYCQTLFTKKKTITLPYHKEVSFTVQESFLPRFLNKGFSAQATVPDAIHHAVCTQILEEFRSQYGNSFLNIQGYRVESDVLFTIYTK